MNIQLVFYLKIYKNQENLTPALSKCHRNKDGQTPHSYSNAHYMLRHTLQSPPHQKIHKQQYDPKWLKNKQTCLCFCCYNITHNTLFFLWCHLCNIILEFDYFKTWLLWQYSHYVDSVCTFQLARLFVSVLWSCIMDKPRKIYCKF